MPDLPQPISHTQEAILKSYEAKAKGFGDSRGVPMGDAANECDRAVWYGLRWASEPEQIDGLKQSRFDTGFYWEDRLLDDLQNAGCLVERVDPGTGKQFRVELAHGWLRGKMDGRVLGLTEAPKTPHVVECKSHNEKSFKELIKHQPPKGEGLKNAKPDHYMQCQSYMLAQGLSRCLYYAVNKNTDERYVERVEFDPIFAMQKETRIVRIAATDRAPTRLFEDPTSKAAFKCNFCKSKPQCHEQAFARQNCRTCISAEFKDGAEVWCGLKDLKLSYDEQQKGCPAHLFLPDLIPGEQIDACEADRTITYRLASGEIWVDEGTK